MLLFQDVLEGIYSFYGKLNAKLALFIPWIIGRIYQYSRLHVHFSFFPFSHVCGVCMCVYACLHACRHTCVCTWMWVPMHVEAWLISGTILSASSILLIGSGSLNQTQRRSIWTVLPDCPFPDFWNYRRVTTPILVCSFWVLELWAFTLAASPPALHKQILSRHQCSSVLAPNCLGLTPKLAQYVNLGLVPNNCLPSPGAITQQCLLLSWLLWPLGERIGKLSEFSLFYYHEVVFLNKPKSESSVHQDSEQGLFLSLDAFSPKPLVLYFSR